MDRRAMRDRCQAKMRSYDVRPPDARLQTANFSGGNQQKIVLAREMERTRTCCSSASRRAASISAPSNSSIAS